MKNSDWNSENTEGNLIVKLSTEERERRKRESMIETAKQYSTSSYCRKFVARIFQRMIRAEAGAHPGLFAPAIVDGVIKQVPRVKGQCVCVTCGKVHAWDSGIKGMHTGHFLASRRNSILLEEDNCHPQCSGCNYYASGKANEFRQWMMVMKGLAVIERLEKLKTESVSFSHDELVDMNIAFTKRLNAAQERMKELT